MSAITRTGSRSRGRAGMTLPETIIAVMVLGIGITTMCGLVSMTKEGSDRARAHYTAVNLGKSRIEEARAKGFANVAGMIELAPGLSVDATGMGVQGGEYRRTTSVTNYLGRTNLLEIVVTVEIQDRRTLGFSTGSAEVVRSLIASEVVP